MTDRILLNVSVNHGYAPDQIEHTATLGDLLEQVEEAIAGHGADTLVILDSHEYRGASFGYLSTSEDLFTEVEDR